MKVEFIDLNNKIHEVEFNDDLNQLLQSIQFIEGNGFIKASDGTFLMIKQIVSFKVINNE